jgi:hypothetical protein
MNCKTCAGSGIHDRGGGTCRVCKGTGQVESVSYPRKEIDELRERVNSKCKEWEFLGRSIEEENFDYVDILMSAKRLHKIIDWIDHGRPKEGYGSEPDSSEDKTERTET